MLLFASGNAQTRTHSLGRHIEFIRIDSKALRGNLIGDPSVREAAILLPPSYFRETRTRYPVVYLLHGLGARENGHLNLLSTLEEMYREMQAKRLTDMVLVAVDGSTSFGGSYFAQSVTIGNFEAYMAEEVVQAVDARYRTMAERRRRAVAGFSMGGHGALKLGMKYSSVFGQVGSLSGSPLSIRYRKSIYRTALARPVTFTSVRQLRESVTFADNWNLAATFAAAAAFSPNPARPPMFLDLPFQVGKDEDDPVWQLWWDDDPLGLVSRYARGLRTMDLIYLDQGDDETTLGTEDFVRELVRYGIGHHHHIFRGDHVDKMSDRYRRMLRWFSLAWQ